jgi:hypothetical protein
MVWTTCKSNAVNSSCTAEQQETVGKPYAGNPHVRFEEGEQVTLLPTQPSNSGFGVSINDQGK